jgi:hypothetical protein
LRLGSTLLQAVTPGSVDKIRGVLGYEAGNDWQAELVWDHRLTGNTVAKNCILFPRPEKKS